MKVTIELDNEHIKQLLLLRKHIGILDPAVTFLMNKVCDGIHEASIIELQSEAQDLGMYD